MQLFDLTPHYGKFNQENMYQTLSESASFCKRYHMKHLGDFGAFFGSQF